MSFIELEGIAYYAKIFEHNRDMVGYEDAYVACNGAYTIELELDDAEILKLQNSGAKTKENQNRRYKFKRKHEVRNAKGEIINAFSGPPQVVDVDHNTWPSETVVGNGSRVRVALSVDPDKKRKSIVYTRLEGVKVLELVEFNGDGGGERKLPF